MSLSDVHEWLGFRYTEKCDLEAARFHFKVSTHPVTVLGAGYSAWAGWVTWPLSFLYLN
jgi:hypothetical protein